MCLRCESGKVECDKQFELEVYIQAKIYELYIFVNDIGTYSWLLLLYVCGLGLRRSCHDNYSSISAFFARRILKRSNIIISTTISTISSHVQD